MSSNNDASMIIGMLMGQEICLILGQVSLSLLYKKRNLQTDICGPGERLTRKQLTSRPDFLWPELWEKSHEKPQIDNARKLRGIYVIDPEDKEFKETIKNARKKLETAMAPAMPCKISKNNQNCGMVINTVRTNQNLRLFWKTVNLQGRVWENLYRIIMKTILQEKETIHCNITIRFTNLFICSKPCKFPQQKQRWTRNGKTWRTFRRGTWRKSEVKKRCDRWNKDEGRKSSFRLTDGHMSFEKCWIGGKAPKIQRSNCTPRRYCVRWFWVLCSIHRTRIFSITNDGCKSHGYHLQTVWLRRTSSWCSIC